MKVSKLLDSPILFSVLLVTVLAFSWAWWKSDFQNSAPVIPNYAWADHPDVAVISNQESCCGISSNDWVETALRNKADVLVISKTSDSELEHLAQKSHHPRFKLLVSQDENLFKFFSPHGRIGGARIIKGQVAAKVEGGLPPTFLFQPVR